MHGVLYKYCRYYHSKTCCIRLISVVAVCLSVVIVSAQLTIQRYLQPLQIRVVPYMPMPMPPPPPHQHHSIINNKQFEQ